MKRLRALTAAALLAISAAPPAFACSFSWRPGHSPQDIRERDDVFTVRGTFRMEEFRGETGQDGYANGWIYGRIETRRGTHVSTLHSYSQFAVECAAYLAPTADANGIFWIKRRGRHGRHELLMWEGEYLPRPEAQSQER